MRRLAGITNLPGRCVLQRCPEHPRASETDAFLATTDAQWKPDKASDASSQSSGCGSFVIASIPTSSPAVGTGATILGGYIFPLRKSDKVSPPSVLGGARVGMKNGTRAWGP